MSVGQSDLLLLGGTGVYLSYTKVIENKKGDVMYITISFLGFDWLKEMQFSDNNVKEIKQTAHADWSVVKERENQR